MSDTERTETPHERLRLSPEDVVLLWGILDGYATTKCGERWPRLERIIFDLDVMMRKQEAANVTAP
jgi:hypothetical protein